MTTAIVVGAGIGGLTAGIALRRLGIDATVYERAPELLAAGSGLSVMSNAVAALDGLGIDLGLEKRGAVVRRFEIRTAGGGLMRDMPFAEICDEFGAPSVCISRTELQGALLDAFDTGALRLGRTVTGYRHEDGGVVVEFDDGETVAADLLIGADGFNSVVRKRIAGPEVARDSGYVCWLALTGYRHPKVTPGYIGHYWGAGRRFGLVDVGSRIYWWGTLNMPAERSADWRGDRGDVERVFEGWAPEVTATITRTDGDDIIAVPSRDRAFLESWGDGPVTLLGDAAHPMLTSLGQGACMAIEDAVVLAHSVASAETPVAGLRRYEDARRERTRAMVANSRAISDMEQIEPPLRRFYRYLYMRGIPRSVLVKRARATLAFPGLEAVAS